MTSPSSFLEYVHFPGMSPGDCFIRMGTSSQPMTTTMIDDLYSKRIHTTLRNIPAPRQDLTFAQLKIYYQERGLELNDRFANSLELLTSDGKYNYIAYFHRFLRFSAIEWYSLPMAV